MDITTYHSDNAPAKRRWLAYLVQDGRSLPVSFYGETEREAHDAAKAEWDKWEVVRAKNIAAREEGRRKAAETRARKKPTPPPPA
jgi:hypothetical protein